jgi:chromatin structure-remodeling complex protein RSC7
MMDVVNDEVALPEDSEGEEKVDKLGNLHGGRDYRVRVFTVKNRGDRLYMLSTEPARCCGFRDSYLFFTKHLKLHKVIVEDDEKMDLIARDIIPHSYKGRSIGVVTARSVFREFGARIIIGGKKIIDDYYVQEARDRGDVEGELADPNDKLPAEGEEYNKNQYVAWHGASAVYHQTGPIIAPGQGAPGKRKVAITSANWQLEHARAASRFNSQILVNRRANMNGVFDIHTNTMHYPKIMQPTHAKWEQLPDVAEPASNAHLLNGHTNGIADLTNGIENVSLGQEPTGSAKSIFYDVPKIVTRNYLVVDTVYESPSIAGLGMLGPDSDSIDVGPNGLPDVDDETIALLPPECRTALLEAKKKEITWKTNWGTEKDDGIRGELQIRLADPLPED